MNWSPFPSPLVVSRWAFFYVPSQHAFLLKKSNFSPPFITMSRSFPTYSPYPESKLCHNYTLRMVKLIEWYNWTCVDLTSHSFSHRVYFVCPTFYFIKRWIEFVSVLLPPLHNNSGLLLSKELSFKTSIFF